MEERWFRAQFQGLLLPTARGHSERAATTSSLIRWAATLQRPAINSTAAAMQWAHLPTKKEIRQSLQRSRQGLTWASQKSRCLLTTTTRNRLCSTEKELPTIPSRRAICITP